MLRPALLAVATLHLMGCHLLLPLSPSSSRAPDVTPGKSDQGKDAIRDAARDADARGQGAVCGAGSAGQQAVKLLFDKYSGSSTLIDFPALVVLKPGRIQSGATNVCFASSDHSAVLPHEVEVWDTSPSGTSYVWVKVPRISAAKSDFVLMYYGPALTEKLDPRSVWDSAHVGVWHLGEQTGGPGMFKDSTSYANHGTDKNGPALGRPGKIGRAVQFGGNASYLDMGTSASLALRTAGTIEAWVKFDALTTYSMIVSKTDDGGIAGGPYSLQRWGSDPNEQLALWLSTGQDSASPTSTDIWTRGEWYYLAGRWDIQHGQMFVNGQLNGSESSHTGQLLDAPTIPLMIGCGASIGCDYPPNHFQGVADEVRLSSVARSNDWIKAQFDSANDALITYLP